MSNMNFEKDLRAQIDALSNEKQPERDLWAGIEIALAEEPAPLEQVQKSKSESSFKVIAIAASFALVCVLSWFSLNPTSEQMTGQDLVAALSSQHKMQKDALLVKFQDQPALTENWQKQLTELDEAADAIKAALKHDSNNIALLKMLQNVHQQQIDLIERVHAPKWRQI
ncbi:hypothetical protein Q4567_20230 [Aliiglaciecola sp. 2_MG-2023]|uniref:hypothetical protein n=1 Tax=unclassified Aliiglaciecola TaxID=2593648 RepID=UPI0026E3471C|nr:MULTISPECIES: hypothetical protein [unclassified Aliiglaciecola]MDO6713075.1 hypothetical protein [Aliiglaciecola sp. 2_MG-2023]MDO6754159.1 hypothetical protein [Aliiglaciecola sp. 1_MG-2023]